jgi:hypothetical protein
MAKLLERIRAWRRRRSESEAEQPSDANKDWKYQGKSFRASDAASHNTLSNLPADEGRPRH